MGQTCLVQSGNIYLGLSLPVTVGGCAGDDIITLSLVGSTSVIPWSTRQVLQNSHQVCVYVTVKLKDFLENLRYP